MKILYCQPSYYKQRIYIPYVYFKAKQLLKDIPDIEWLDPLPYIKGDETFDLVYADVVLLTCYVWNIERNVQIARKAKEINPNCIVIAGGPQIPLNEDPFLLYPEFDYVCTTEIENVFPLAFLNDFKVPGMRSRNFDMRWKGYGMLDALESPWIEYREELNDIANRLRECNIGTMILWETNRGCPYKCTFCDWGSATNSKIRRFNHETLLKELDVFSEIKSHMVYIADANFGIFKNELEYIQKICDLKEKTGYPTQAFFSSAKNNKVVVNQSYALLHKAGLLQTAHIAFQHTDDEVLEAIDRSNIKNEKLIDEMKEAYHLGVPLVGMLIIGNPGDTLTKFQKSYYDLFELGFHDDIKTQDFMILPNAPASDKAYIDKWKIKTIERWHIDHPYLDRSVSAIPKAKYICSTSTFDENDYLEIQVFNAFILAAHIFGATKFISIYLRYAHNVSYGKFYDSLWNNENIQRILTPIRNGLRKYIEGTKTIKLIDGVAIDLKCFEVLIENHDEVLDICESIIQEYEDSMIIEDLLAFQKNVLIKWGTRQDFQLHYNINEFFNKAMTLPPGESLNSFDFKIKHQHFPAKNKYYRSVYLNESVPTPSTKMKWRKVFKKSNLRFRNTYKASIIFDESSQIKL
jgi:putative methyltransferase